MKRMLPLLYAVPFITLAVTSVHIQAAVTKLENQDAFTQQLKDQKRLAVVVIDRSQFKEKIDVDSALSNLHSIFTIVSNKPEYRLSNIGFATIELDILPEDTRKELITALGGKIKKPATLILFEHGTMIMDDGKSVSGHDVSSKVCDVIDDFDDLIEDGWGSYIAYTLSKRHRADARRLFTQAKKQQVALAQNEIDQQGLVSRPTGYQSASYDPALYGYGEQPAYQNSNGDVYYNYPYYNGGVVPGVGMGVGVGLGIGAAAYDRDDDFRGDRSEFRSGNREFRGGRMRSGGRGRR